MYITQPLLKHITQPISYLQTYRKVEQELKNRQKKRQKAIEEGTNEPAHEESYVDKDRAIVVSTGHSDLKGGVFSTVKVKSRRSNFRANFAAK